MGGKTAGTGEWAYKNLNIDKGCPNNCSYCYAYRMAKRFKRNENRKEWSEPKTDVKKVNKEYRKLDNKNPNLYDYMFPTSHDITPLNIENCLIVLKKVLEAGNTVLITTKPNFDCIVKLCQELEKWKDIICFRFTITSFENERLKRYESHAPLFIERSESLKWAFEKGFKTSLSLEPLLDLSPLPIIDRLEKYVNDTIWIGIMSGKIPTELKENYTPESLKKIYEECRNEPQRIINKIRFKDSFVNKVGLKRNWV